MEHNDYIIVKGAKENNLKNIDVRIPKNKITAITGVSGSGKSSLAFDTIFALGKVMYLEALSFAKFEKPNVDHIEGLMPPIAISQKMTSNNNPRSTVGTSLQVNTYLRLLFALIGEFHCPNCNIKIGNGEQCPKCGYSSVKVQPNMFSFNHLNGMCPNCNGLGLAHTISTELVLPDTNIKLKDLRNEYKSNIVFGYIGILLDSVYEYLNVDTGMKFSELNEEQKNFLLYGYEEKIKIIIPATKTGQPPRETELLYPGIIPYVKRVYGDTTSEKRRKAIEEECMKIAKCPECDGKKLNKVSLCIKVKGLDFSEILNMSIKEGIQFFTELKNDKIIVDNINHQLHEVVSMILKTLDNLSEVGLDYITLDRQVLTLSGGEAQRLRLCNHLNSELTGVLYVFDEPSAGLHSKDIRLITNALRKLRDIGNTVIVVEHNNQIIMESDYIVDVGPGAGLHGGEIVAAGSPSELIENSKSVTGKYLAKKLYRSEVNPKKAVNKFIEIKNADTHNLKNISVKIPLKRLVCITGVSGSGKSTLINDVLYKNLSDILDKKLDLLDNGNITGAEHLCGVYYINQNPIGRNQRSTIATYTGLLDQIRKIFAGTQGAKLYNVSASDFSLNSGNGRCEKCSGLGYIEQDMYFMPSIQVVCEACNGTRYKDEILNIEYKGFNIAQILDMTAEEALELFSDNRNIASILETLRDIGLTYVKLGQSVSTLSGGECQRLKLVSELYKKNSSNILYIFDEPSNGLHPYDIEKLIFNFNQLISNGNSVIVIEHNLNIISQADYIIDLGPEGGNEGGEVVATGHPFEIIDEYNSHTANSLKRVICSEKIPSLL